MKNHNKTPLSRRLTPLILILGMGLSLAGILFPIYRDNPLITSVWQGNDLVTLFVACPLLLFALLKLNKGFLTDQLLWLGCTWYFVYNYFFYLYGAAFNVAFIFYVLIVILSLLSFIFGMVELLSKIKIDLYSVTSKRTLIISRLFLVFFSVLMGLAWSGLSVSYWFTQTVPLAITQTDHPTGVIFATDLIFLVTPLILAAYFLSKKHGLGIVLTPILMVKCILYPLVFVASGILAYLNTQVYDVLTPVYLLLGVLSLLVFLRFTKELSTIRV